MLEKNLKALNTRNPELVQKLLNHVPRGIDLTKTETGEYNLIYDGIPLHNTIDPQAEAKLIFGEDDKSENILRLIFGLGLGYLFKRTYISSSGSIIIFEPSLDVLKITLQAVDFSNELNDTRVFLINDVSEIKHPFYKYIFENVTILFLDSYKAMYPDLYEQVYFALNNYFIDQNTNLTKSLEIAESFIKNLPYIVKASPVNALKDKLKNLPALVVSAGPSLDKTINLIKEHRDKFVLISVGQAVKALHSADIVPDIVVIIEMIPVEEQIRCLGEQKSKIHLLLEPSTNINLYKEETKSKFVIFPDHDYMSQWLADKVNYETSFLGTTVSIAAFSLATLMGANPIILVGQDLAYVGNQIYASNTLYESMRFSKTLENKVNVYLSCDNDQATTKVINIDQDEQKYIDRTIGKNFKIYESTVIVKGQNGEKLYTLNLYANIITTYAELTKIIKSNNPELRLINSSIGGAYIEGFEHIELSEVIKDIKPVNVAIYDIINQEYIKNKPDSEKIQKLNKAFSELLSELKQLKIESQNLITFANKLLKEIKISNKLTNKSVEMLRRLIKLDNEVKKHTTDNKISFIYPLIQKELFEYNKLNDKMASTDFQRVINTVNSMKKFSETMIIGADRAINYFNKLEGFPFEE